MKKRVREMLERRDLDGLADLAEQKKRVLGVLTSLTFDSDPLICWRAVEAMGVAAGRIAESHPGYDEYQKLAFGDKEVFIRVLLQEALDVFKKRLEE